MSTTSSVPAISRSLDVPGARLHYEVRGAGPLVVLVGAPMDARAFAPLADALAVDHTVLTTDPRGVNRSLVDDPDRDSTPEVRADDLARLVRHVDAGPATVFGSSGGAVSALALVQAHPELVDTVIAHEPPLEELLDDRDQRRAATDDIIATYRSEGSAAAWGKFLAAAGLTMPDDGPHLGADEGHDRQAGGGPEHDGHDERDPQDVADERHFFLHEMRPSTVWVPDITALRAAPTRIVVGIGEQSRGQVCDLTSNALAAALDSTPAMFPGDHTGFVDDPDGFAARLRAL